MNQDPLEHGCLSEGPTRISLSWEPPEALYEVATEENGLIAELIESYSSDVTDRVGKMVAAVGRTDGAMVRQQAHAIKGSSKQMAAYIVASLCEQIEAAWHERPLSEVSGLVAELEIQVREICAAMVRYQKCAMRTNVPANTPPSSGPMIGIGA